MECKIETLVVATDFSENAELALEWGIHIAQEHDGRIELVHAIDGPLQGALAIEVQAHVGTSLAELEERVRARGVDVESAFELGRSWEIVVEAARESKADLVVIGSRGRTAYQRLLVGKTADRILRTSPVPVLIIHPDDALPEGGVRTVLTATDFSDTAVDTAETAARLVCDRPEASRIVLVHVIEPIVIYEEYGMTAAPVITEQDVEQARVSLEKTAQPLRDHGFAVETVVREGYPASSIQDEARERSAHLIAVGTHGRQGLERLMLGSVAERIVHHAPCPVLSVRRR